jgi:hypothetical protein
MRKAARCILVIPVFLLILNSAMAKKIYVPSDSTTIQGAISGAVNGDTVFVETGTHSGTNNYNLAINGKDIVIMGEDAANTFIDLSAGQTGFYLDFTQEDANTIIQDLTIRNGSNGMILHESAPKVENVRFNNNIRGISISNPFGILNIKYCQFNSNDTGVASYVWSETTFNIDSCIFQSNDVGAYGTFTITDSEFDGGGSGVGCGVNEFNPGTRFDIDGCDFHDLTDTVVLVGNYCNISNCKIQNNTGIIAYGSASTMEYSRLFLSSCQIDNNAGGITVDAHNATLTMSNCRYLGNGNEIKYIGINEGTLDISGCYIYENDRSGIEAGAYLPDITIRDNIIAGSLLESGVTIDSTFGDISVYGNTVYDFPLNGIAIGIPSGNMNIDSNIVMNCNGTGIYVGLAAGGVSSIACNDVFNNTAADYGGILGDLTGVNGNISAPPLFCNAYGGDFHLQPSSPCLPGNNSCGTTIGRYGSGCETLRPLIITAYSTVGLIRNAVNITVIDPDGYYIGKNYFGGLSQTLYPASYFESSDTDMVVINYPIEGTYTIQVVSDYYYMVRAAMYSIGIRVDGTEEASTVIDADAPDGFETDEYGYVVEEGWHYMNGDANRDEMLNILDVVYVINCLYKGGPLPYPVVAAEANCNLELNILDVVYMINYLYKGGPEPCPIPGY